MDYVTTYARAWIGGEIELCDSHAEDPRTAEIWGPLGQVLRGEHRGRCAQCDREWREQMEEERQR